MIAASVPRCSATSKVSPSATWKSSHLRARMRCADDETGRNSVRDWTSPRINAIMATGMLLRRAFGADFDQQVTEAHLVTHFAMNTQHHAIHGRGDLVVHL